MANNGHYQRAGGTRQGIYVCTPSGVLLSSINSLNPDDVLDNIKLGLEKWKSLPQKDRQLPEGFNPSPRHRWEKSYPSDGMVLKSVKVDLLSDPPLQSERGDRWNIDHVWFNNNETHLWLPENPQKGDLYTLPTILTDRLFCFHLVDNVRGQTLPFAPQEIKEANIDIEIKNRKGNIVELAIEGASEANAKGPWLLGDNDWTPNHELNHSINTSLLGSATYDLGSEKFTEFEMVAIGNRIGKTQNNGRKNSPEEGYVGFLFTLAGRKHSDKIAPAFVDLYNAEWITRPANTPN